MYNVSDEFKSAIQSTSRLMSCKAYLNGVELSVDKILKLDIEDNINNGDYFTIGEVPSKLLTIEMLGVDVIEGAEIKPYYGVEVSPGEFEYIPCGVFYVDSFTTNKNKVTATCYDKMLRLDDEYIPNIAIPVTLSEITNDICQQKEIEFEGQLPSITINKSIKGYSYREMIGFIASFCGGNAKFNRFGKLIIQQYVKSSKIVNADVCGKFEHKDIYTVSAIACKFGDIANTRGDSSANCVNFTNPFVDDTNIDSIFNRLNGLSFMASSFKYNGDPSIDSGELITVNDIKGNSHTVLVSTQSFTFSGGLSSEVTSIGEGKGANAYKQYKFKNKKTLTELNVELGLLQGIISEVEEKQEDTYSKTETETLIEAKAGEISLEVAKNEVNNLQIGGSNLLLDSHERKRLDRPTTNYNQISYNIIDSYKDLRLERDTAFSLSFLVDRVANTQFECFDTITFDVGWRHRWTRDDIQEIIRMKGNTYKFIMKSKVLPKGVSITDKLTFIGEYQYGGGIFYNVMLTQGSKPMDWSHSSGEIPTTTQMNSVVNQKADSITSEVSKIERSLAIDNILENGNFTNGLNSWTYLDYGRPVNYTISANTDWVMKGKNALLLTATNHPQGVDSGFVQTVDVKPNTDYTFTGYMASHRAEGMVIIKDNHGAWLVYDKTNPDVDNYTGGQDVSKWKRVRIVYNSGNRNKLHLHLTLAKSNNNGHVWFHDFMVTEGDNDLCWKPSEKETRTKITQLSDRITSTVTSINTVDGKVNKAQSEIDQQAQQISSKVSKNDFSSLVQQNGQSVMVAINNKRTSMGVYIDKNGLSGFNNNVRTFRLTEGKFHVYNSWNSRHIGYFGTLGDDLRATLFGTNTFSVFSDDKALLFRAKYEREARYGNATLDMCGGINFIHKPGQSTGTNQILLGNHDVNNQYGMHNMFIRCHNSLGFADNGNMTHMFLKTRTGDIVMKGRVYQNTATPPRAFSLNFDGEDEVYRSGFTRSQAVDSIMHLKTGVHVDAEGECCSAIYGGHDELITTKYQDEDGITSTHINTSALNASLVVTCQEQQKLIEALQKELNEIKKYLKIAQKGHSMGGL